MRRVLAAVVSVLAATAALLGTAAPAEARAPGSLGRVVLIGDSVATAARASLQRSLRPYASSVVVDTAPCRGVVWSCTATGVRTRPATGVTVAGRVRADTVVVELGYNDTPSRASIERLVATLSARGVRRVLWLTLHEGRPGYASVNAALAEVAAADPTVVLADWRAAAADRPEWFTDGVHLTPAGVRGFDAFVTRSVAALARR
jgi:hypothetical protein